MEKQLTRVFLFFFFIRSFYLSEQINHYLLPSTIILFLVSSLMNIFTILYATGKILGAEKRKTISHANCALFI